ncbi:hypothetical protein GALL_269800 [mine drainage metagenome]|uniref:Uncharacterized protein n=1 Tax=mine drainage metagenome TaxID=410659 RepID=A0A1J5RGL1_9ZZZZ
MKIDDATETITRYFNEIIGILIPGAVLVSGLVIMHSDVFNLPVDQIQSTGNFFLAFILILLYSLGNGILAIDSLLGKMSSVIYSLLERIPQLTSCLVKRKEKKTKNLENKDSYIQFCKLISNKMKQESSDQASANVTINWSYHDARSIAMSASSEASSLARRFMFISSLCNGVGTALLIIMIDFSICTFFAPKALFQYADAWPANVQIFLQLLSVYVFFRRGEEFYIRAMSTPFAVALAELSLKKTTNESPKS